MATPNTAVTKVNSTPTIQREEFGATQIQAVRETASTAVAAREKAAVEARYIMAVNRPRDIERTRQQLLKACSYPDFAEAAWYSRPAGRAKNRETGQWEDTYAEGFSIRFAEEALRAYGNVYPEMAIVFESEDTRIVRITVTDLESNLPYSTEIVIKKQVERKKLKDGQVSIGEHLNSQGEKVFIVEATDDEILQRVNALRSKAMRTDGLRLIPAWLKEECKRALFATMEGKFKQDPDAAKRKIIDAFGQLGISVKELEEYLGKSLERATHPELVKLQPIFNALREGEVTWDVVMESRPASGSAGSKDAAQKVAEEKLRDIKGGDQKPAENDAPDPDPDTQKEQPRSFNFGGAKK